MRDILKNAGKQILAHGADVAIPAAVAATTTSSQLISNHSAGVPNFLPSPWNTLEHKIVFTLSIDNINGIFVESITIVIVFNLIVENFSESTATKATTTTTTTTMTIVIIRFRMREETRQLQQGICIIRLISLKRFLQIPRAHEQQECLQEHQQKAQPQNQQKEKPHEIEIKRKIKIKIKIKSKSKGNAKTEIAKGGELDKVVIEVVKKLDKLNDNHEETMGNDVTLEREPKSLYVLARSNPERFRLQFYKFNFPHYVRETTRTAELEVEAKAVPASTRNKATAVATSDESTTSTSASALPSPKARTASRKKPTTTSNLKVVRANSKTLRKLSAESKVAGISEGAINGGVSECSNKSNEKNNSKNDDNNGGVNSNNSDGDGDGDGVSNVAFIVDAGNGKKCGNPLQVSSQIFVLTMCVLSHVLCSRKRFECSSSSSSDGSSNDRNISCDSGSKRFDFTSGSKRRTSCWPCSSSSPSSSSYPSSLSLQRSLIMLILLSALWQQSVCFHGSVKLSSNTVKTKYGLLRGIVVRSAPSVVEAYLGIPYASPPVGSLRFMPPITPSTWKNVRNADRFSPVCPQTVPIPPNGPEALLEVPRARLAQLRRLLPLLKNQSEDCLYLNIYVPYENRRHRRFAESDESTAQLPAILFIHGESFEWNSGNPYDGSELAAHGNVIVVTINFRLGIFGFLKTGGKESAQGNFGLMDLVAGLHWLKENLPAFGGDPQSITLFGHGTGAALANILIVSPVASDLIHRAVLVSGSALSPWAIQKNPLLVKRRVAEQTGCHGDMLYYDIAPCLRTKSVTELLAVSVEHPRFLVGFAPFIDGTVISPNINSIGSLTLPLGSAIVSTSGIEFANFPKRNLIFCLTSVESYLDLSAQDLEFGFNETRRDRILRTFVRNNYHYHLNEIFAVLKNEYTDWEKAIRNPLSSRDATLAFLSDGHTASSLIKLGYMHSLRGGQSYFLHFKHKTMEEEYPQRTGSVRGEDLPFWFGLPVSPLFPYNYTTQEKQISRLMLRYLANFAKTGNPNLSTKSSQMPSLSTSTLTSNVLQQPQSVISDISSISPDSQRLSQYSQSKVKRSSAKLDSMNRFLNITAVQSPPSMEYTTARRQALDLAVIYNQRRSNAMRDKRTGHRRRLRSNDDQEEGSFQNLNIDGELPFWDGYDVVNQLYLELGNKIDVLSHYRGHKLSMWLNLIPQLHKHSNINDQSMRHHQFVDDIHNQNLYEGIVRPQLQTKPPDEEEVIVIHTTKSVAGLAATNKTNAGNSVIATTATTTTDCGVDGALLITTDITTLSPNENRSLGENEKDTATASTGVMSNLEVLRRLSGKQFQSYTTALVATVAVGCFLLILNILIFAGIYHQREKRARDAKTKEELQDGDASKNSSLMKLNTVGRTVPGGDMNKTTMIFGEYSCYDEKTKQLQAAALDEKLLVELPPPTVQAAAALHDTTNWACSTSTIDLLKTKHHLKNTPENIATVPILLPNETGEIHLHPLSNIEMATYHPINLAGKMELPASFQQHTKRGSFGIAVSSSNHNLNLNQFDYAVQSSDKMSFKDIEDAVKASAGDIRRDLDDDDIPEPPPPPRSFQQHQQQQQQQQQQQAQASHQQSSTGGGGSGSGTTTIGGGILRQSGGSAVASTSGGKKRVHIQEISV